MVRMVTNRLAIYARKVLKSTEWFNLVNLLPLRECALFESQTGSANDSFEMIASLVVPGGGQFMSARMAWINIDQMLLISSLSI